MLALAQWLSATPLSLAARTLDWLVPFLQTIHILAIAMVVSSVFMIDLRILGFARAQSIGETAQRFMPWIWSGLAVLAMSGIALIVVEPMRALPNPAFQIKMALLAAAVAGTCLFQMSLRGDAAFWQSSGSRRTLANVLAVSAFLLWCVIAGAGRLIAYLQVT
jgi:Family of unknown function (DUF6644)